MPLSYHESRGANFVRFVPIPADNFDSELVRDASADGDTLTGMIPLLTERDTAIRLRVTLNDLNTLLESGTLPYSVIGGEIRITDDDIRDLFGKLLAQGCGRFHSMESSSSSSSKSSASSWRIRSLNALSKASS